MAGVARKSIVNAVNAALIASSFNRIDMVLAKKPAPLRSVIRRTGTGAHGRHEDSSHLDARPRDCCLVCRCRTSGRLLSPPSFLFHLAHLGWKRRRSEPH